MGMYVLARLNVSGGVTYRASILYDIFACLDISSRILVTVIQVDINVI
jgi:hypothetical protein